MANKREFKKYVDTLSSSIYNEMMISYCNTEGIDKDKVSEAITRVLKAMETARMHSNIFFDKGARAFDNKKEYSKAKHEFMKKIFNKISKEYTDEIDAALKIFNAAIPENVKEENKKFA